MTNNTHTDSPLTPSATNVADAGSPAGECWPGTGHTEARPGNET